MYHLFHHTTSHLKVIFLLIFLVSQSAFCQTNKKPLTYFLPDIQYDKSIPTPEAYLGFQIGEWHVSHDQLVGYFQALDAASDRMELVSYGRSHENRPLLTAIISSAENIKNKENIREKHLALSNANTAQSVDISSLPLILWHGYTIHGNEASGNNAALLVAYYLVAGQSREVDQILRQTLILLDPCQNPDGVQRFSTWVNSHKSSHLVSDPQSREFSETWPGGRYNHYWFDMNRDWLLLVHPESRGRISMLHRWQPNVLTDHHEMGTNSTFYFHPGAPSSNNPNTPEENFILTEELGKYHAHALDSIGSLYYTKYNFDDFYYGKGSTYPDALGAMGILFEQASSRGHLQESVNGPVSFPFTIRNQVNVSLSTQKGCLALRDRILQFKQRHHQLLLNKAASETTKGYIFTCSDRSRLDDFLGILLQHHVDVYTSDKEASINGNQYPAGASYVVPIAQAQPILAKTIFEKVKNFKDSSFYDVSGWTLPLAYGLQYDPLSQVDVKEKQRINSVPKKNGIIIGQTTKAYAYLISAEQTNMYPAIYSLQSQGIQVRCALSDFELMQGKKAVKYQKGTAIVHTSNQTLTDSALDALMHETAEKYHLTIEVTSTGNSTSTLTIGHPLVQAMKMPSVAAIAGNGIQPQSAGEVWHHLDKNLSMPLTILEPGRWRSASIQRYNTLILPEGSYSSWNDADIAKMKEWVQQGNTLICVGTACQWLASKAIINLTIRKEEKKAAGSGNYENAEKETDARVLAGSIFQTDIDLSHPLNFGLKSSKSAVMKTSSRVYEPTANAYATPAKYSPDFLLSGYLPKGSENTYKSGASTTVHGMGSGKIICFHDNPLFRGYWKTGERMFDNALFLSGMIESKTIESGEE